jgi:hypothetical protein
MLKKKRSESSNFALFSVSWCVFFGVSYLAEKNRRQKKRIQTIFCGENGRQKVVLLHSFLLCV